MTKQTTYPNGTSEWCNSQGKRHRTNGPALHYANGAKFWFINGEYHNLNGHATQYHSGSEFWFINGKSHNINGPANLFSNGNKNWFINGTEYSESDYNKILKLSLVEP